MSQVFHARFSRDATETFGDARVSLGNRACGVFAEWNWDGEQLTLINDRYGFFPIYYFRGENEVAVSPSISKLVELLDDVEFDDNAFSVFLRFGYLIAEDTLFKSIRAVPPGSTLTWQRGRLKIESTGIINPKPLAIPRAEAVETYATLFQRSIERTLPPNDDFFVPLSGGRDSRHILFAVCKANRKPTCLTLIHPPPRANEDARISQQICETLKLDHVLIEQSRSRFEGEIRKNERIGFCATEHGWFSPLGDFVEQRGLPVYDGIAGDVLTGGRFLTEERLRLYDQNKLEELADKILAPEGYLPKILSRAAYRDFTRDKAVAHLVEELARHTHQPNPVGSFRFWNRARRCIALSPFRLLGDGAKVITPYLDADVFDFLSALPGQMLVDRRFHTDTISFAFPKYAEIPYEDNAPPPVLDFSRFRAFSRDIVRYSATKRHRQLTNSFFFLSRHLRALIDKTYSRAAVEFGEQAILLMQLERLMAKNGSPTASHVASG